MTRAVPAAALFVGLAWAHSAVAAGGTVTDQAVSLVYGASHWGLQPATDLNGVDATGDPVYEAGWWYRAEGDTQEFPLPPPDSETYVNGLITAVWNNLDGKHFELTESTYVLDNEGPSGGFLTSLRVVNKDAFASRQFRLFHYLDVDLASTGAGDSGTLVNSSFIKFSDGSHRVSYRANSPSHYQVAVYPGLRAELNDAGLDDLNDTGLPFGPADASAAFELGPWTLAPGASAIGLVSATFNPARDHVKGDFQGVLGQPPLYAQGTLPASVRFTWMRRTAQFGLDYSIGPPSPNASAAGTDDFHGDFSDDVVFRDTVSGIASVWGTPITGAPTLPLNWKLSATGDFNADGKADILWRNTTSQKLVIWTMNGPAKTGSIVPSPDQAVNANWEVAAAADFNGDAQRDLLWYNQTTGKIVLWYMNASVVRITGLFTTPASVGNNNWSVRAVGDFGKGPGGIYDTQDIVWQNDTSKKIVVWFMDQAATRTGGTFTTPDTLAGLTVVGPR